MATTAPLRHRIQTLKKEYDQLKKGKESLLVILDEVEVPEGVYNSNAIENSTLTLKETEKILLEMEVSRDVSVREVFEAKNLARVMEYVRDKVKTRGLDSELLLFLHQMLMNGIDDEIAGRFRTKGEYVRVGSHIAAPPENIEGMVEAVIHDFSGNLDSFFSDKIAMFHLDFEVIHPFNDGNGRMGRVIINYQLAQHGFPPVIIRDKEKRNYYEAFKQYNKNGDTKPMEKIVALAMMESLHKRITYLRGDRIILLAEYANKHGKTAPAVTNAAHRQNIAAFREKGVWKIGESVD